jgi:hypothetical protein
MRVYQQVLDLDGAAPEQLELVLGRTVDEAFWLLSGGEPGALAAPGRAPPPRGAERNRPRHAGEGVSSSPPGAADASIGHERTVRRGFSQAASAGGFRQ